MPDAPTKPPEPQEPPLETDPYLWYGCAVIVFFLFGLMMRWDKALTSTYEAGMNDIRSSNPGSSRSSYWGGSSGGGGGFGGFGGK